MWSCFKDFFKNLSYFSEAWHLLWPLYTYPKCALNLHLICIKKVKIRHWIWSFFWCWYCPLNFFQIAFKRYRSGINLFNWAKILQIWCKLLSKQYQLYVKCSIVYLDVRYELYHIHFPLNCMHRWLTNHL